MKLNANLPKVIVGIDPGWANFACCALIRDWKTPYKWTNERILDAKMSHDRLWHATMKWCEDHKKLLGMADVIVVEQQHEAPLQLIQCVIRTLYPSVTMIVSPLTICSKFELPRKRAEKKAATVALVKKNVRIPETKKQDDLADAFLLAFYGLMLSGESVEGWKK